MADTYWREMTTYIFVPCIHARINNKYYVIKVIYKDRRRTLVLLVFCKLKIFSELCANQLVSPI